MIPSAYFVAHTPSQRQPQADLRWSEGHGHHRQGDVTVCGVGGGFPSDICFRCRASSSPSEAHPPPPGCCERTCVKSQKNMAQNCSGKQLVVSFISFHFASSSPSTIPQPARILQSHATTQPRLEISLEAQRSIKTHRVAAAVEQWLLRKRQKEMVCESTPKWPHTTDIQFR